jgi:hypothetical protein
MPARAGLKQKAGVNPNIFYANGLFFLPRGAALRGHNSRTNPFTFMMEFELFMMGFELFDLEFKFGGFV